MQLQLMAWALRAYWVAGAAAVAVAAFPCLGAPPWLREVILVACSRGKTWRQEGGQSHKSSPSCSRRFSVKASLLFKGVHVPHRWFIHFYVVGCAVTALLLAAAFWATPHASADARTPEAGNCPLRGTHAEQEPAGGAMCGQVTDASSCLAVMLAAPTLAINRRFHACRGSTGAHAWFSGGIRDRGEQPLAPTGLISPPASDGQVPAHALDTGRSGIEREQGGQDREQGGHDRGHGGREKEGHQRDHPHDPHNRVPEHQGGPLYGPQSGPQGGPHDPLPHRGGGAVPFSLVGMAGPASSCSVAPARVRFLLALFTLNVWRHLLECLFLSSFRPTARMHLLGYAVGTSYYVTAPLSLVIDELAVGPAHTALYEHPPPRYVEAPRCADARAPQVMAARLDGEPHSHGDQLAHPGESPVSRRADASSDCGGSSSSSSRGSGEGSSCNSAVPREETEACRGEEEHAHTSHQGRTDVPPHRGGSGRVWRRLNAALALPALSLDLSTVPLMLGAMLFFYGSLRQHKCHRILANCRKTGDCTYTQGDATAVGQLAQGAPPSRDAGSRGDSAGKGEGVRYWGAHPPEAQSVSSMAAQTVDQRETCDVNGGYHIPRGDWFELVSCPHYLAEVVVYLGLLLVAGASTAVTAWLLLLWVVANLTLGAVQTHHWYKKEFSGYPSNRTAIFPHIL
eukprot:jgi/Mesvir1/18362/Mv25077-RA.2